MLYEKLRGFLHAVLVPQDHIARPAAEAPIVAADSPLFPTEEELDLLRRARQRRLNARSEACAHGVCA